MHAPILVAGAGPGGLAAAVALARRGFPVRVFERHPEVRAAGAGLTLQINAIRMLDALGLGDAAVAAGTPLEGGAIETAAGALLQPSEFSALTQRFGRPGIGIHRGALADLLAAALPPGALALGAGVTGFREEGDTVVVTLSDGREERGAALIGADGIHSAVRRGLFGDIPPRYAGYTCWRGLAEHPLGGARLFERWGAGRRFGLVPISRTTTYWFATRNAPPGGADGADVKAELHGIFAGFAAPVPTVIDATPAAAILRNDIVDLPVLPAWTRGRVTLLGDAAHAMTPNLGQGACQAIEDAVVLAHRLATVPDVPAALLAYEAARRPRAADVVRRSDQLGRIAQWENPLACALRDALVRLTPASVGERQMLALYGVDVPA